MKRNLMFLFALAVSSCGPDLSQCMPAPGNDLIYVVSHGWHAEFGIPVEELDDSLDFLRQLYPGAQVIMFGYGKKTFITAPADTFSEYFLGPLPGPAVIQVVGLRASPLKAYSPENTVVLDLPSGGSKALSAYIWGELSKDTSGNPMEVARSTEPDGVFYASESEYNLFHTCNTWTADALARSGFPISADYVIFSNQVMNWVNTIAETQCLNLP